MGFAAFGTPDNKNSVLKLTSPLSCLFYSLPRRCILGVGLSQCSKRKFIRFVNEKEEELISDQHQISPWYINAYSTLRS